VDIYEVKSILQEVANTHWRQFDEEAVRKDILDRIKKLSAESEVPNGEARFGGIVLAPEDVLINKDDDAHTLSLQIRYTRYVKYPFLERQTRLELSSSRTLDTTPVKW
ncbi:MAG TPA: hypothetical protein VMK12_25475, partial [Anaeromyxobacteraceae bacterium]|nr:hypothetical protein [Anaeromyxobacteraceae bacterium]